MKKKIILIIKIILSFGLLFYLFGQINFNVLLQKFTELKVFYLFIAVTILFIQVALSSLKWRYILTAEQVAVPYQFLLKSYLLGHFFSLFLPSSFGGDVYRIYALKKYNMDSFQNASSVIFDRISGLFALSSISILSYVLFYKKVINYQFFIIYILATSLFLFLSSEMGLFLFSKLKFKLINYFIKILKSFNQYRTNKRVLFISLLLSFFFQSNIVIINKFYCMALNIDIELKFLFMVIPLIYLTEALPISINGLGVREGAFVFFFSQAGYTNEEALGLALLVISMRYLFSVTIGGSLFLRVIIFKKEADKLVDGTNMMKSDEIII
jgi:uncharacterized protein (TIRG00374 family)